MRADPVLIAYTAKRTSRGKTVWTRIGEAYPHEQGAGLTVKLSSLPLDGTVILLELDAIDDTRLAREAARVHARTSIAGTDGASVQKTNTQAIAPLSLNEFRLARRLLQEADAFSLTWREVSALRSVKAKLDYNSFISDDDIVMARQLLRKLGSKLP